MKKTVFGFLSVILYVALLVGGIFYEFLSCALSVALCVYIIIKCVKSKHFVFNLSLGGISALLISVSYIVVAFWGIDKGDSVIGFFKFLPVALFSIALMQEENEPDIEFMPYIMSGMTVVSSILMQIPAISKYFSVSGRLSGFFQYSNTFALLLLVSIIVLATKADFRKIDYACIVVLLFGIIYSGSRTVFVLMLVAIMFIVFSSKNKALKIALPSSAVIMILAVVGYAYFTHNMNSIGRFLTISLKSSTFVGRFLYFTDALPLILKHPFGLGYMGYYYIEQSIQTGVYSVKFIHNDFLQLALDIGWIPMLVFVAAIVKAFFRKGNSLRNRMLLLCMSAHFCFDFDLQYVAVFILFISLLDINNGKEFKLENAHIATSSIVGIFAVACVYIGISQAFFTFGCYMASQKMYPLNTQIDINQLSKAENVDEMDFIADRIIKHNKYVPVAYSAKASTAFSNGDFRQTMQYKNKVFEIAPFSYSEYEQYCYMLIKATQLYHQYGDTQSEKICLDELSKTIEKLLQNNDRLSRLGKMIDDHPQTELPNEIIEFAEEYCND